MEAFRSVQLQVVVTAERMDGYEREGRTIKIEHDHQDKIFQAER